MERRCRLLGETPAEAATNEQPRALLPWPVSASASAQSRLKPWAGPFRLTYPCTAALLLLCCPVAGDWRWGVTFPTVLLAPRDLSRDVVAKVAGESCQPCN